MQPKRQFKWVLALSLLLGACAAGTSITDAGDGADLRAAATATLAVKSFHIDASFENPAGTGSIDYQAPDREDEHLGTDKQFHETISIGDNIYITPPGRPGYFWQIQARGAGASDTLGFIKLIADHAENVLLNGRTYTFDLPTLHQGATGEATVSGGLLATVTIRVPGGQNGDDLSFTFAYSGFNSGITVEPPNADHIVKQPPTPTCPPSSPSPYIDFCNVSSPTP